MPKSVVRIGTSKNTRPVQIKHKIGGRKSLKGCTTMTNVELASTIKSGGKDRNKVLSYLASTGNSL